MKIILSKIFLVVALHLTKNTVNSTPYSVKYTCCGYSKMSRQDGILEHAQDVFLMSDHI